MKSIIIAALLIHICTSLSAQYQPNRCGENFDRSKYPADSFSIRKMEYKTGSSKIVIHLLHYDYLGKDSEFFQMWIEQRKNKEVLRARYWGDFVLDGNGFQLPAEQPVKDYFIILKANEFSGTVYLISEEGIWYQVPGHFAQLDTKAQVLYTFNPQECGECKIGKFVFETKKLTTKTWNGEGDPWPGIKRNKNLTNVFSNGKWITW